MEKSLKYIDDGRLALSPTEAARRIGIGRTHLYSLIKSGALKTVRLGKRRLITIRAIEECLAAHECQP
jgi:excisionase family DNA binding protein